MLGAFLVNGATGCVQLSSTQKTDVEPGTTALASPPKQPNILLILADDLGYSDIGALGGEISTPNLDALVAQGRLLTNHHVATVSAPTRAMLMSGTDNHLVGLGQMQLPLFPDLNGLPGYEGYLNDRSLSVAELVQDAGYHTYIAGKWHLGSSNPGGPANRGFTPDHWGWEHSYTVIGGGAANHFGRETAPSVNYVADGVYKQPGQPGQPGGPGQPPFYSTDFYTDRLIEWIDAGRTDGKPFFAFAAYTSPHWPLQVPEPYLSMYKGKYDAGYDAIRAKRIERLRALGLLAPNAQAADTAPETLTPEPASPNYNTLTSRYTNALHNADDGYPDHHGGIVDKKWASLTDLEKKAQARYMEIYAGMVTNLDDNIGRLLQHLKDIGEYNNTFIMFHSDNGADGWPMGQLPTDPPRIDEVYAVEPAYSTLGTIDAPARAPFGIQYGRRWAEVCSTPLAMTKGFTSEGGFTTAAIVKMPGQSTPLQPYKRFTHITDDTATILDLAGAAPPTTPAPPLIDPATGKDLNAGKVSYKGRAVYPVTGHSLRHQLSSPTQAPVWTQPFGAELYGRAASYSADGQWKARFIEPTFGPSDGHWQLYHITQDVGETTDVSAQHPEILQQLIANWQAYMTSVGGVEPKETLGYYPPRPGRTTPPFSY